MITRTHDLLKCDEENATAGRDADARLGPVLANVAEHETEIQQWHFDGQTVGSGDEGGWHGGVLGWWWRRLVPAKASRENC